jgi:hypothetical protein
MLELVRLVLATLVATVRSRQRLAMAAAGSDRSAAVHAAPPASAPPRMPPRRPGSRRRCRRRLGCVASVPRHPATRPVERFGPEGQETPPTVPLRGHIEHALKCTDVFRGGVGLRHALTRPLQREQHRSPGPSLAPSCVVSGVVSTTTRCDSLGTALDFGCGLIPGQAPAAIDLPTGAVGSPQSPGRPSLHAGPSTPERFQAAPESKARTAAFARLAQARPARSLTGLSFDAAGFNFLTACSFVPPPFGSASRRLPEISLPGSSGGLPGPDSHRLVASPCWAVRELLKLGIAVSARSIRRYRRRGPAGPPSQIWHTFLAGPGCPRRSAPRLRTSRLMLGATRFDRPATPKMTAKSCQSWHCSAGVTRPSTSARGVTAVAGVEASASVCG